jgi:hypothetical protein
MKLMWFHLMPYTELPDDFREQHPSVWVDIHSSLFDPLRAASTPFASTSTIRTAMASCRRPT